MPARWSAPSDDASAAIGDAYESVARLIGAQARNVAIVENATVAFFQALSAFDFRPGDVIGDEILATAHDHYVHQEAIRLAVERTGATWRKIPLFDSYDAISADEIVDRIRKAIRPNLVRARHLRNSEHAG